MSTDTIENEEMSLGQALSAAMDSVDSGNAAPVAESVEHEDTDLSVESVLDEPTDELGIDPVVNEGQPEALEPSDNNEPAQPPEPQIDDRAPSSWKSDIAQKWSELPPEVRAEIQRRETDYHRGIEQYKQGASIAQEVQQAITPFMQNIQAAGVHPLQAITGLLEVEHTLRNGSPQDRAQKLAEIARDYGIDLQAINPLPPVDPHVQQLIHQNQQLQQFQQATVQQQQQAVLGEIEAFRANPENTHFESVKEDMSILLQSGRAASLQDAYDKAVWMRPDIRQTLVHQQSANAQKQQAESARKQRAQTAAGGVKGSAPSKTTPHQHGDLRSAIAAAWDGES